MAPFLSFRKPPALSAIGEPASVPTANIEISLVPEAFFITEISDSSIPSVTRII